MRTRLSLGLLMALVGGLLSGCAAPTAPTAAPTKPTTAAAGPPAASPAASPAVAASPAASPSPGPAAMVSSAPVPAGRTFTVGISQFVSHPALDASRQGVVQALTDAGFKEGQHVRYDLQNGQRDMAAMTSIAQRFRDQNVDIIVAISTPALQAALSVTADAGRPPVVFDSVTDPYAAAKDVIRSPDDKPAHVTGIQAMPPVKDAMQLALTTVPAAKRIGMIWTPAEANSAVATELARQAARELNVELVEQTIASADEVLQAAQSLLTRNVDLFFVSTDSTVVSALESVVKVANDNKKPLFGNDPDSAARGAVAALGIDYFDQGYDSGVMAALILKGEKSAREIPITPSKKGFLAVNTQAARLQGVTLSDELLQQAAQKYDEIAPAKPKS